MKGMHIFMAFGAIIIVCHGLDPVELPQDEMFRYADHDNDARLDRNECVAFWLHFDGDGDHLIGKPEFELKWTFLDFKQTEYSAFFYKQLDNNMDRRVDSAEITRMCNYFDDDSNGHIDRLEFDMNWIGLFTLPTSIAK